MFSYSKQGIESKISNTLINKSKKNANNLSEKISITFKSNFKKSYKKN